MLRTQHNVTLHNITSATLTKQYSNPVMSCDYCVLHMAPSHISNDEISWQSYSGHDDRGDKQTRGIKNEWINKRVTKKDTKQEILARYQSKLTSVPIGGASELKKEVKTSTKETFSVLATVCKVNFPQDFFECCLKFWKWRHKRHLKWS